jgi:response regulator RpfG family c-di-GMP phosphodiesterase
LAPDERLGRPTPDPEAAPAVPLRILVIDDEPEVRRVMRDLLGEDGHPVIEATGG